MHKSQFLRWTKDRSSVEIEFSVVQLKRWQGEELLIVDEKSIIPLSCITHFNGIPFLNS
jgi:hypothetical protein